MSEQARPTSRPEAVDETAQLFIGYLSRDGVRLLDEMEASFKARAKELHRVLVKQKPAFKLMAVQEAISVSLGFPNTHALQRAIASLRDGVRDLQWEERRVWLQSRGVGLLPCSALYRLTADFRDGGIPLEFETLNAFTRWARSLAKALGLSESAAADALAVAWAGAESWSALKRRTPLAEPLGRRVLSFHVTGDPCSRASEGRFHLSKVGHWACDHVLGSLESVEPPESTDAARRALDKAIALTERYPDLLAAWSAAALAAQDFYQELGLTFAQVHGFLETGLRKAEATWPKGFKGRLSWEHEDNRTYLRILHQKLNLELRSQLGLWRARRTALKIQRFFPGDAILARRGPLLLGLGQSPGVLRRYCIAALSGQDASGYLHAGLSMVCTDHDALMGVRHLVHGILLAPEFGALLLREPSSRPYRSYIRPAIGFEDPLDELSAVFSLLSSDPKLHDWLLQLLRDKELLSEEQRWNRLFSSRAAVRQHWQRWEAEIPEVTVRLAKSIFKRYPLPVRDDEQVPRPVGKGPGG